MKRRTALRKLDRDQLAAKLADLRARRSRLTAAPGDVKTRRHLKRAEERIEHEIRERDKQLARDIEVLSRAALTKAPDA